MYKLHDVKFWFLLLFLTGAVATTFFPKKVLKCFFWLWDLYTFITAALYKGCVFFMF